MRTISRNQLRLHYHKLLRKPAMIIISLILKGLPISSRIIGPPKGLISNTKDWVAQYNADKKRAQAKFIKVSEGQDIRRQPPQSIYPEIHPVFNEAEIRVKDNFVAVIPNGRVWGSNGAIITPDDKLLEDVSAEYDHERYIRGKHSIFTQMKLPRLQTEEATVAVLTTLSVEYYSHWLLDILPRVELLNQAGYPVDSIDKFYLLEPKLSYHTETLNKLGISASKIIDSKSISHFQAHRLLVPSLPTGTFRPTKWICEFLRREFLPSASNIASSAPQRIYISRAKTQHRRVLNEDKVIDFLRLFGFSVVLAETMTIAEKAALFARAEVVVFPAGSGYVNVTFCPPGAVIIELFNPAYLDVPTWALCDQIDLIYYYCLGEESNDNGAPISFDMIVNISHLAETLRSAGINSKEQM